MRWLTNFYDFRFKSTATAAIGIHPTKAWLSQLVNFKNAIWHFRRTILSFKLGKMPQKRMECFTLLLEHLARIDHQFLSGIRDSRKTGSLLGMIRGVGGVRQSISLSRLAKGFGLGLLCWVFKWVQKEIPSEEASILQIASVAFLPGQCTSPQLHPCHRLFDQDGHQDRSSTSHSLHLAPCDFWLFPKLRGCSYEIIEEIKEAETKVIDALTEEDFHGALKKFLER